MERVEVWQVYCNTDLTEGRGSEYILYHCKSLATAQRLAKGRYIMGSDCPIHKGNIYKLGSVYYVPGKVEQPSSEDLKIQKEIDLKESIISKVKEAGISLEELEILLKK